jgi:hypothetical protein
MTKTGDETVDEIKTASVRTVNGRRYRTDA